MSSRVCVEPSKWADLSCRAIPVQGHAKCGQSVSVRAINNQTRRERIPVGKDIPMMRVATSVVAIYQEAYKTSLHTFNNAFIAMTVMRRLWLIASHSLC